MYNHTLFSKNKKKFTGLHQVGILLSIIFLIASCTSSKQNKTPHIKIATEDRSWMEPFFRKLMLDESGIYTLHGSKPITTAVVYYYTEEEMYEFYELMTDEEKKKVIFKENDFFSKNWEKWEKLQEQIPLKRYLLFKEDIPDDPKAAFIHFVDIVNTALTLNEHYELVKTILDEDFNPFDVACDYGNPKSRFWEKIKNHSALTGILFGFGFRNSWCFHWKYWDHSPEADKIAQSLTSRASDKPPRGKENLTNFSLPLFASFENGKDETIEKYEKEREYIRKIYKGKDFLEVTLQKLTEGTLSFTD